MKKMGNVYLTGWTYSSDFPIVSAIYGSAIGGISDIFVTKIGADLPTA